jgi:O-antigen ligase
VAVVQFCGVDILRSWPAGNRQPSFTGIQNLGTLGAAALALAFLGELWPESVSRRTTLAAFVGGTICVVLSGEAGAGVAVGAAMIAALLLVRLRHRFSLRRAAVVVAVTAFCALGLVALRGGDIDQFARSLGILPADRATTHQIQTYAQRTLMLYIGLRIWEAHPLFGAGWQSVREYHVYSPFLAAAHRRFPNEAAQAFPSPVNRWGVDNAYVESLAELGLAGTAVLLGFLGTTIGLGIRGTRRAGAPQAQLALLGVLWMLVTMGLWAGVGFNPGSAFAALPFVALGLVAAARAGPGTAEARVP